MCKRLRQMMQLRLLTKFKLFKQVVVIVLPWFIGVLGEHLTAAEAFVAWVRSAWSTYSTTITCWGLDRVV